MDICSCSAATSHRWASAAWSSRFVRVHFIRYFAHLSSLCLCAFESGGVPYYSVATFQTNKRPLAIAAPLGIRQLDAILPQNIFARYVRGEGREEIRVVADTDEFLAFWDAHPAAKVHLLIVPKKDAVRNPNCLRVDHVELLERMVSLGVILWSSISHARAFTCREICVHASTYPC